MYALTCVFAFPIQIPMAFAKVYQQLFIAIFYQLGTHTHLPTAFIVLRRQCRCRYSHALNT